MPWRWACALIPSLLLTTASSLAGQSADRQLASREARSSPEWLKSGVIYQIFVGSFSAQGNLEGVTKRLDTLQKLGVNILWLMPLHPRGELKKKGTLGSPYSVRDYYAIDRALGTKEDLRKLVRNAHERHMKVILDMVANHTAWDSVMMAHKDFYKKDKQGNITYPYDWSDVAALDYSNPKLRRYMTEVLLYWIKELDVDGYRCDAAAEVPTDFWEAARRELERVKPDMMMLAEASKPELLRSAFDIDYAWPELHSLDDVVMKGKPATTIRNTVEHQRSLFPKGALHMRITDDHDELRAVTRYGYPGAIAASALMMSLDGVPLIYNGMEVGDCTQSHGSALFEPQKIFWQAVEWHPQYPKFYAAMVALRKQHAAVQQGEIVWLRNSDEQHVLTYMRRSGTEQFLIAVNLSNTPFHGTVEVEKAEWREVALPAEQVVSRSTLPELGLGAFQYRVFETGPRQ
jgi:glycosidase